MNPNKMIKSFRPAIHGITTTIRNENNFQVHLVIATAVVIAGLLLQLSAAEWLWIVAAIGLVLIAEMMNTAFESLTDLVSPQHQPLAGKVKDVSAGAVLIASITSVIIGLVIFVPYIKNIFSY